MNNRATSTSTYQTNALQFTVEEELGGVARNPEFSRDRTSPFYVEPDRENLYNFRVSSLGVLDLSLVPGSPTIGDRFVRWIWIQGAAPLLAGEFARITLVDAVNINSTMRLVATVGPGPGEPTLYYPFGVRVPQGAALRFNGWRSPVEGTPIRLRVGVIIPQDNLHWASQMQAFCCSRQLPPAPIPPQ